MEEIKKKHSPSVMGLIGVGLIGILLSGCQQTYPEQRIASELQDICRKEYGIDNIQVKFAGTTIGVYLPVKQLFATTNFKEALASNVKNIESLLEPSQEAMDRVEDVLFSTSRVVLSTDKQVDFYALQATDENAGLEMLLVGYVPDIKRVRIWDIARSEYRKRVLHDLRLNRTVIWWKPIRELFEKIGKVPAQEIISDYFPNQSGNDTISGLFYQSVLESDFKQDLRYEFLDVRSQISSSGEALIYAKAKENYSPRPENAGHRFLYPSGTVLEHIFIVEGTPPDHYYISRVIPFYYLDDTQTMKRVPFPPDLKLDDNLNDWKPIFDVSEIQLGDFLATQLTRRIQGLIGTDERIFNTFTSQKFDLKYSHVEGETSYFSLDFNLRPKSRSQVVEDWKEQEDFLYAMNLVIAEVMSVLRSYQFEDYDHFDIVNTALSTGSILQLQKSNLELFRRKKLDIQNLLRPASPI